MLILTDVELCQDCSKCSNSELILAFALGFVVCFLFIVFINFLYYQFFSFKE